MPKKVNTKNNSNPTPKRRRADNHVEDEESDSSECVSQTEQLISLVNSINSSVIALAADQSKNHAELKANVFNISEKIDSVIKRVDVVEQNVKANQNKLSSHDKELEKLNIELRKLNLIVVGLADDVAESDQSLRVKLQTLITEKLTQSEVIIDKAYRFGKFENGVTRPIKIQFRYESHRDLIWNNRNKLRTMKTNIFINEDLPPVTQNRRRILRNECSKFFKLGHSTRLLGDKLFIDSVCYELDANDVLIQSRTPNYNRKFRAERGQSRNDEYMDTSGSRTSNFVNVGSSGSSGSLGFNVYGNSIPNPSWSGSSRGARPDNGSSPGALADNGSSPGALSYNGSSLGTLTAVTVQNPSQTSSQSFSNDVPDIPMIIPDPDNIN